MKNKQKISGDESTLPALAESWAEFLGDRYSTRYHGNINRLLFENGRWQLLQWNSEELGHLGTNPQDRCIPYGIFHDIVDANNVNDANIVNGFPRIVQDNAQGIPPHQLYSILTPFVHSPQAYRIGLSNSWGSNQRPQINQLFESYGY